jgi:Glycosyl hydrolases family 2, TIM barrel domain/Glycosyl hydrolases family 2, sugar binding domain/Glycosyl hydrolases family 2
VFSLAQVKYAALGLALSLTLLAGWVGPGAAGPGPDPAAPGPPAPPAGPAAGIAGRPPVAYSGAIGRVALGGVWTYKADPGNAGLARRWFVQRFGGRRVTLPYSPNAWPVTGPRGYRNFNGSVGWYRTTFSVPAGGAYALRFESIQFRASVWLDGKLIGRHMGAYMPFELRPLLRANHQYLLVVRADWRDPVPGMKRLGWHRGWFNYGGIEREVTIRRLQGSEIEAPVIETAIARDGSVAHVTLRMRVQNRRAARVVAAWATLTHGEQSLAVAFPAQRVGAGARADFVALVDVPAPALWSPGSPALYDLRLFVPGEGGYQARVGLRQITVRAHHPYLNGQPLFVYGASIHEDARGHGDALTAADMDRIVARLERIGANATRAQHPLNPALLDRLDAAGIVVWQEIGPWDSPGNFLEKTKAMQRAGLARVRASFEQLALHPSIFAWNLGNEVGAGGHPGQGWFIDTAARWLKANDPGRLTALDVWGIMLPKRRGLLYAHIDALGTTSYFGWYEEPFAKPARIRKLIAGRVAYLHRLFPAKVIVASEFGAEGNRLNAARAHGGLAYQAWLLKLTIDAYVKLPDSSGEIVWNLQDFGVNPEFGGGSILHLVRGIKLLRGLNQKGLFDPMGRAKPAVAAVAAAFKRARLARG